MFLTNILFNLCQTGKVWKTRLMFWLVLKMEIILV